MRPPSGSGIGTVAVCAGCGVHFVRRKFMQQYHDNRCRTARGPYGYITQMGLRGRPIPAIIRKNGDSSYDALTGTQNP